MANVSAVITYHNRTQFFPEAFESAVAQTRRPQEVIVVDDGSSAEQADFLEQYRSRAVLVRLPRNQGVGAARNEGLRTARGDLIAFLDDDDIWLPDKLAVQAANMEAHPEVDVTHTGVCVFFEDGSERIYNDKPSPLRIEHSLRVPHLLASTAMFRRRALDAVKGFDPALCLEEDSDLQIRMVRAGMRIEFLPQVLTRFRRQRHDRLSTSWLRLYRGGCQLLRKHKTSYRAVYGPRGDRLQYAYILDRCGARRGGLAGWMMGAAGRLLGLRREVSPAQSEARCP